MELDGQVAVVDLFCGAGGKTHGFIRSGVPVVAGVDLDPDCKFAYEHNNGAVFHCRDVDGLTSEEVRSWYPENAIKVLIGCAPCQPFSTYSYRYNHREESVLRGDERWGLIGSFGRLIRELRPEIVTAENVPTLERLAHGIHVQFIADLKALGYNVMARVVRCADYGVPQTRERLVIMASRLGSIDLEPQTHRSLAGSSDMFSVGLIPHVTVRNAIGHLPPIEAGGLPPDSDPLHRSCRLSALNMRRIIATPQGGGWPDWPNDLKLACHLKESGKTYPSVYGRMSWDSLAPTITTQAFGLGNGRFGHPDQHRAISLREAALLQTFPPDYVFTSPGEPITFAGVGRHIGNAVPVELGAVIARSIKQHLRLVSALGSDTDAA